MRTDVRWRSIFSPPAERSWYASRYNMPISSSNWPRQCGLPVRSRICVGSCEPFAQATSHLGFKLRPDDDRTKDNQADDGDADTVVAMCVQSLLGPHGHLARRCGNHQQDNLKVPLRDPQGSLARMRHPANGQTVRHMARQQRFHGERRCRVQRCGRLVEPQDGQLGASERSRAGRWRSPVESQSMSASKIACGRPRHCFIYRALCLIDAEKCAATVGAHHVGSAFW